LKTMFEGRDSRELLEEARREESLNEEEWRKRVGAVRLRL